MALFSERYVDGDTVKFRLPEELLYTTKQAIQEGFILDVIKNYTPVESFYRVAKKVEDDLAFDKKKTLKKIRHYVEPHDKAIRVDRFHEQVIAKRKLGGQARHDSLIF